MRVIAGSARGHRLLAPPGQKVRPTSDRVKAALFNALGPRVQVPVAVDLFAGTGALGIEALSRGAGFCVFVERDAAVARVLVENLRRTGLAGRARVLRQDVFSALPNMGADVLPARAGLVLADPPYGGGLARAVLERLGEWTGLDPEGAVAIEHAARNPLPEQQGRLRLLRRYVHGDTAISLYAVEVSGA